MTLPLLLTVTLCGCDLPQTGGPSIPIENPAPEDTSAEDKKLNSRFDKVDGEKSSGDPQKVPEKTLTETQPKEIKW